jgi:hypothetical protein
MPRYKKDSCLTIIKEDGKIDRYIAVLCQCSCGNIIRCKKTLVNSGRKSPAVVYLKNQSLCPNIL